MIYREIGKSGLQASIIGLGAEHVDFKPYEAVAEVVSAALDHGVNIIDMFMPGTDIRQHVAKALGGRRNEVILQGHVGSYMKDDQYARGRDLDVCRKSAEEFLRIFGHMDLGMMFFIDTEEDFRNCFETGYADYMVKLKRDGYIRSFGFSSHNPSIAMKVIDTFPMEAMLFSINPAYDMMPDNSDLEDMAGDSSKDYVQTGMEPKRAKLYSLCQEKGVGITVMKTLGSGRLLDADLTPLGVPLTVTQCIHYALSKPAVASVLIGCKTSQEVQDACAYLTSSDEEKDFSAIAQHFKGSFLGQCVYCNHCLPCPSKINIAETTRLLDVARINPAAVSEATRQSYERLAHKASACVECGSCEKNCPFSVKIIENMRESAGIFGC